MLIRRTQKIVTTVVNPTQAQAGFILERQLVENVLLAIELIKDYGRGQMSQWCMIKIDLRKAYDSLE